MQQCLRNKSAKIPYASAYLPKVGDAPRAFVVLGFADATSLKWFTADRNMIGFTHAMADQNTGLWWQSIFSDSANADPLSDGKMLIKNSAAFTWQHRDLWSAKISKWIYTLTSTFQ